VITIVNAIQFLSLALSLVVLADIVVSYFLDIYHPVRRTLDTIVQPMLSPIRRVIPPIGMLDFSPLILILLIQLIEELLVRTLLS
jgi:YggT family protein